MRKNIHTPTTLMVLVIMFYFSTALAGDEENGNLYIWKDKNGVVNFSNTEEPKDKSNVTVINNATQNKKETHVVVIGNQIIVPVILGNRGKTIKAYLLLDTGCTDLMLHHNVATMISPRKIGEGRSTIANGQQMPTDICMIDFVQVGPFVEKNFLIHTQYVRNVDKQNHHGLLGMTFLKKHPFQIDMERKIIKWL